jgi:hypothetical protein
MWLMNQTMTEKLGITDVKRRRRVNINPSQPPYEFGEFALQARPRSADRTRSPAAVSQKREFFKYPPETIGYFAAEPTKFGIWRQTTNLQKPAIGGAFLALPRVKSPGTGLVFKIHRLAA